jgi:hypothetical protein
MHTPMRSLSQKMPKEGRIRWLQPMFEQARIWFPDKIVKAMTDGRIVDILDQAIEDEYKVYPSVSHDDWLDCMANMCHPEVAPTLKRYENKQISFEKSAKNYADARLKNIFG